MSSTRLSQVEAEMRRWLERAVIGLNLCPFAKSVYVKGQVRFRVVEETDPAGALAVLGDELDHLVQQPASELDTTLLVFPDLCPDFIDFMDLVSRGERVLRKRGLEGVLQLASFHPAFVFGDAPHDHISNFTNRAPHPTLHLLREDSIARAVEAFPDAEAIYGRNMETLERLGAAGWNALDVGKRR